MAEDLSSIADITRVDLSTMDSLAGEVRVWGHNQHVISLADSRNTGSFGKPEPITIAQCFSNEFYWSVSFRNLWGNNQALTGLVETGDLQPLQNLNQLTELNLRWCKGLTGQSVSDLLCGDNQRAHPLAEIKVHWLLWLASAN